MCGHEIWNSARSLAIAAVAFGLLAQSSATARADDTEDPWPGIKQTTFGNQPIASEDGMVILDAPETAEDASIVPITVRVPPEVTQSLKSMMIIIDKNPEPIVATFTFGPAAGNGGERSMATRVRVDSFSHIRAIVETADGKLHMTTKFIAASGGCGAMNAKDADTANNDLGKLIVRTFPPALDSDPIWTAQLMIKHPNNNGLQVDLATGGYVPARLVDDIVVKRGKDLVFEMKGGGSISENPNFRFTFGRGTTNDLDVAVKDSTGSVFTGRSVPSGS